MESIGYWWHGLNLCLARLLVLAQLCVKFIAWRQATAVFKINAGRDRRGSPSVSLGTNTSEEEAPSPLTDQLKNSNQKHPAYLLIFMLTAIKIDGRLLVKSTGNVTNVPSINSVVRANPAAGFSIVNYTAK